MGIRLIRSFIYSTLLSTIVLAAAVSVANGQNISSPSAQEEVATVPKPSTSNATSSVPVFTDYHGVKIGMTADEVRSKLDRIKKGDSQDFVVFSESESAQIYYDEQGKVTAISVDYFGDISNAPSPDAVLGAALQAKANGSMHQLNRYPEVGYWVSYSRTAGEKPIITVTMQKM